MRYISLILITLLSIFISRINLKLHSENYTKPEQKKDIILQLNFLETELKDKNLGERMQHLFPEGYVFIHALYGLAWSELALSDNDPVLTKRALHEALYAYNKLDSKTAKWNFPDYLEPKYGIFYAGWKNYLLSKILSIDTTFDGNEQYIKSFRIQSSEIMNALVASNCPFLESYESQSWPADMFVAMASISNHDKVFVPRYHSEINNWLLDVKERLRIKKNIYWGNYPWPMLL